MPSAVSGGGTFSETRWNRSGLTHVAIVAFIFHICLAINTVYTTYIYV